MTIEAKAVFSMCKIQVDDYKVVEEMLWYVKPKDLAAIANRCLPRGGSAEVLWPEVKRLRTNPNSRFSHQSKFTFDPAFWAAYDLIEVACPKMETRQFPRIASMKHDIEDLKASIRQAKKDGIDTVSYVVALFYEDEDLAQLCMAKKASEEAHAE